MISTPIPPEAEGWMREAIELGVRGRGDVEPNPRVGALALSGDRVVGRGYHRYYGGAHAEVEALRDAEQNGLVPDTIVVTLEPCSSRADKKTAPCTQALLDAGIRRVIVGMIDPDPRHRGRGLAELAAAGIEVLDGVLADECSAINRPFARWLALDRPWTIAKWAMTLDGKTATRTGDSRWISGEAARTAVHTLRSRVDGVVVGFRTATADDPELTVRHVDGRHPVRLVVDPRGELRPESRLAQTARDVPVWALVREDATPRRLEALDRLGVQIVRIAGVETGVADRGRGLDLTKAWRELRDRGMRRLLVEGGGRLLARLLAAECVDQTLCYVAPKIVGGVDAATPVAGRGAARMDEAMPFAESYVTTCGDDVAIGSFRI